MTSHRVTATAGLSLLYRQKRRGTGRSSSLPNLVHHRQGRGPDMLMRATAEQVIQRDTGLGQACFQ